MAAQQTPQKASRLPADTFASRLLLLRHDLGLTVQETADLCEIPAATWSTWERGTIPRNMGEIVAHIAAKTGYDLRWLMWGYDEKTRRELLVTSNGKRQKLQKALKSRPPLSVNHPAVRGRSRRRAAVSAA